MALTLGIISGSLTSQFSGSFTGSFTGNGSQLTNLPASDPFPYTGDVQITGSVEISGSGFKVDTSLGTALQVKEDGTIVLGANTSGATVQGLPIGYGATIYGGVRGVAVGYQSSAGSNSVGIGGNASAGGGNNVVVVGGYASATANKTVAVGYDADVSGIHSIAIGSYINASGTNSITLNSSTYGGAVSTSTANSFEVYMTSNSTPDFQVTNTHITASGNISGSSISTASFGTYLGDGSQLTGINSSTNLTQSLFVSPSGDDGTAVVGDLHLPFKTILGATGSANIGDTIIVYPGTYLDETSNIIKDGVNYYFYPGAVVHPTASLSQWVVNIIDPTYPVNVRGAGTFISDDTEYGAIKIQAKECYFEFDTAKTTNNTTNTFNEGGTVALEPTNTDGGVVSSNSEKGNPFYVKGKIINTGNFGNYSAALVFGRDGIGQYAGGTFEGSVMQLHPTDTRPAIWTGDNQFYHSVKINADVFASGSEAVLSEGRGDIVLRGKYTTGLKDTKYAVAIVDGYHQYYDIDADIIGSLKLGTGGVYNSGGIVRGRILTGNISPDDCAIYISSGGQHKIDNQIYCRDTGAYGILMAGTAAQVEFTGDFNADAASSYVNFCKVTTGKLIFKGSLGSSANRGTGNVIDGGHLVIDSFFDNDGYNYPNNSYCFVLSAGTLEINNKVTHAFTTTGSGIIDMTGGYLKLNGAELVQLNGTGSFAYGIDLNSGTHSGSILNNSFTNVTPFGPGSFTNEITGGGTLFYSDKLY